MPDLVTGKDDNDDNQNDDNDEHANQSSIPLVVTVSKGNGPVLEFSVTAYPDEFQIDSLAVKNPEDSEDQIAYEGPGFHDLDENLQKAFHKYLELSLVAPVEKFLSPSEGLRGDARRKALFAADPIHPIAPSNCKRAPGKPAAATGLETGIGVEMGFTRQSISSEHTS
ncbi:hypothetical protein C1H46_037730 [Malus baccata]|uniref:Uncharacterized protein n=1 Tax=Malus baccata TaxID=106549 RepID=A0A540KR87_MALBA|nr:hypothetical protein C1H46_037730 [Malus baccata]